MDVTFNDQDILELDASIVGELKQRARQAARQRARLCLHRSNEESVHEMVICLARGSYIRPHRHAHKTESFHIIEGQLVVHIFDEVGKVVRSIEMGELSSGRKFMYRLSADLWHTVVPLTDFVVFHETTRGPFVAADKTDGPAWAPPETDATAARAYLASLP